MSGGAWGRKALIASSVAAGGLAILVGIGPRGFGRAPSCVAASLASCPLVREVLGEHPSPAWIGGRSNRVFGSDQDPNNRSNTPPGHQGWAYGSYEVGGSRGSGMFEYVAYYDSGTWVVDHATLKAGGQTIDVVHCSRLGQLH